MKVLLEPRLNVPQRARLQQWLPLGGAALRSVPFVSQHEKKQSHATHRHMLWNTERKGATEAPLRVLIDGLVCIE